MIDPAGRLHNLVPAEPPASSSSRSLPAPLQSFGAELEGELARSRVAAGTSIPPRFASQGNATGLDSATGSPGRSASVSRPSEPSGLSGLVITYPEPATTPSAGSAPSTESALEQQATFDEAYWASQPAPVQQLQNISNLAERTQLATQLAGEGYSIDVPIMVWGWDPQITTQLRQSMGYTWVPSALQNPVELAPGLAQGSQPLYNPANPPPGSILV